MVFERLVEFKPYQEAKRIGIYLAMPNGELQTDAIVRHALQNGKQVFVPYLHKSTTPSPDTPRSVMDMVDLRSLADFDALKRDSWGIPTISSDTVDGREHILKGSTTESLGLDMILMPGVAFDFDPKSHFIRRLGHGKGFYDYFLYRYWQSPQLQEKGSALIPRSDVLLYGLALQEQFLTSETGLAIPVGDYDYLLHGILVGDGKLRDSSTSGGQIHRPASFDKRATCT